MMLVQKAQPVSLSSPAQYSHRRHPSASVVVQPTHIPGLLTLSKPPRPSPSRQHQQQHRNHGRIQPKNGPKPSIPTPVRAQTLTLAAEITDNTKMAITAPATPSPQSRGRLQAKNAKEKNKRSTSQSSLRPKHSRQPSPPVPVPPKQFPSQAEVPIKSTNPFDPFVDHSSDHTGLRRQSKAIPVPSAARKSQIPSFPSSDPLSSRPMFQHQRSQRPRPLLPNSLPDFPICDDMSEIADDDHVNIPLPFIPRRLYDFAPKTAPISPPSARGFPFGDVAVISAAPPYPISPMKNSNRRHRRTPSEGVFHMSSDEEVSSGPGGALFNPNVKALFGLVNTPVPVSKMRPALSHSATPSPSKGMHTFAAVVPSGVENANLEKAGFFASSMFQNSPSPDELPDPLLL